MDWPTRFCNFCTEVQGDMRTDVLGGGGGGISPSLYPTIPIDSQDSHNTRSFMPSSFGIVFGFFNVPQWTYNMEGICETGPTVYRPYLRRLESLTICWFNYKGSTLYAVILRPWVLVWPNLRPPAWQPDVPPTEQPVRGTRNCRVVNVLGGKASYCIQWAKYCIILAESTLDWPKNWSFRSTIKILILKNDTRPIKENTLNVIVFEFRPIHTHDSDNEMCLFILQNYGTYNSAVLWYAIELILRSVVNRLISEYLSSSFFLASWLESYHWSVCLFNNSNWRSICPSRDSGLTSGIVFLRL